MITYYIGAFPPVYGGVTIKNQHLYDALSQQLNIRKIDMSRVKRGSIRELLRLMWALLTGEQYVIGLAGQRNRRMFTKFLYTLKRKAMQRSVLLVMGGIVSDIIAAGPRFLRMMQTYRQVYLEFPSMAQALTAAGLDNAAVYPNARPRPAAGLPTAPVSEALQCVFFSQIQPEKGADLILQAAQQLPKIRFHFYGNIVPSYQDEFQQKVRQAANVTYHGLFFGSSNAVYTELSRYDLLLLPTRCKTEGLPGILVEAKIAGVPAIVTDHNHNREIVEADVDGIVLAENTTCCLSAVLKVLDENRERIWNMRQSCRVLAERYYIDVCAAEVIRQLCGG